MIRLSQRMLKVVSRHREVSPASRRPILPTAPLSCQLNANRRPILPTDNLSFQPTPYPANGPFRCAAMIRLSQRMLKVVSRHREVSGKDLRCRIGISNGLV
jgi:hypothetical protein